MMQSRGWLPSPALCSNRAWVFTKPGFTSWCLGQSFAEARAKARNAALALERLVEERFADPDALGTALVFCSDKLMPLALGRLVT